MAAPTNAANVKKALANSEPSTHSPAGPDQPGSAPNWETLVADDALDFALHIVRKLTRAELGEIDAIPGAEPRPVLDDESLSESLPIVRR